MSTQIRAIFVAIVFLVFVSSISALQTAPLFFDKSSPDYPLKPPFVEYHLYIPAEKGQLRKYVEIDTRYKRTLSLSIAGKSIFEFSDIAATTALEKLLRVAPHIFPPGTELLSNVDGGSGYPKVVFNEAFANETWWKNHKNAQSVVDAITQTAVDTKEITWPSSGSESLTFIVNGKSLHKLGNAKLWEDVPSDELIATYWKTLKLKASTAAAK